MAECNTCGGFVTDDYVRVFGDNEGNVFDCRSCRASSIGSADESEDAGERVVLLRDVCEDDTDQATDAAVAADDTTTDDTSADTSAGDETRTENGDSTRSRLVGLFSSLRR